MVQGYDIIGDIHGCAAQLENLLAVLGYRPNDWTGAYWHPHRRVVFVGDLIDRGPEQLRVLKTVKGMVDAGSACIVMGNHELNAIAYDTEWPARSGEFLRPHDEKNTGQHQAFLDQVTGADRAHYLEWFKTLPVWLDLGDLRVVHACWHEESMRVVEGELGSNRFNALHQFVRASSKYGDPLFVAVETLLKGPEISHGQPPYHDKDGHPRDKARVRWWDDRARTLREIAEMEGNFTTAEGEPYPAFPDIEVPVGERSYVYTATVPVFYGHYWRQGSPKHLHDWTAYSACVDFSAVKGGRLTAYRWSGESQVRAEHYVHSAEQ